VERLRAAGVVMRPFPEDVMRAAWETSEALLEEAAAERQFRKIYDAYKKWRNDAYAWFSTAEMAYADFAFGPERRGTCGLAARARRRMKEGCDGPCRVAGYPAPPADLRHPQSPRRGRRHARPGARGASPDSCRRG